MAKVLPNGAAISNDDAWIWSGAFWIRILGAPKTKEPDKAQTDHARVLTATHSGPANANGMDPIRELAEEALEAIRSSGSLAAARQLLAERYPSGSPEPKQWIEVEIEPQIEVKAYKSPKDFEADSREMIRKGWQPQNQAAMAGHMNVGRTLGKVALTGGLGLLLTGASRTKDQMTVTWVRRRTERREVTR